MGGVIMSFAARPNTTVVPDFTGLGLGMNLGPPGDPMARAPVTDDVSRLHFSQLANQLGMSARDVTRLWPNLQVDAQGNVATADVSRLLSLAQVPVAENNVLSNQIAQMNCIDPGDGEGARCSGGPAGGRNEPAPRTRIDYAANEPVHAGMVAPPLNGLSLVRRNGERVLTGTVNVMIVGPDGVGTVPKKQQLAVLNHFRSLNQGDGKNRIDLNYQLVFPGDPRLLYNNPLVVVKMDTQANTTAACSEPGDVGEARACVTKTSKVMNLPYDVPAATARHEFAHILGLGHNKRRDSLLYVTGGSGTLSSQELSTLLNAYAGR